MNKQRTINACIRRAAVRWVATAVVIICTGQATAQSAGGYLIQPGDVIRVSVWKEPDLQQDLLVRPDGGITFPLAGPIPAGGRTVDAIQADIVAGIETYIPDPVVTVQLREIVGNTIYVLGKVNRPGAFVMSRPLDVAQALALSGGLGTFAAQDDIVILRRPTLGGEQSVLEFRYSDLENGTGTGQNIMLQAGDVVVVP